MNDPCAWVCDADPDRVLFRLNRAANSLLTGNGRYGSKTSFNETGFTLAKDIIRAWSLMPEAGGSPIAQPQYSVTGVNYATGLSADHLVRDRDTRAHLELHPW